MQKRTTAQGILCLAGKQCFMTDIVRASGDSPLIQLVARRPSRTVTHKLIHTRIRLHESLASRDVAYLLPLLAIFHLLHGFLWATVIGSYAFAGAWLVLRRRQPA